MDSTLYCNASPVPLSPYLGPDQIDSPVIPSRTCSTPSSFVITPGRPGARDRVSMVGQYKLGRTLGKGSCGVVKLGTNLETGKKVAVKVLRPKNPREHNEIEREISALKNLDHPNIIRLIEVIRGADLNPADESSADGADILSPPTPSKSNSRNATGNGGKSLDKYIFMVLELASGGELFEKVLQGGPLKETEARIHMRNMISALCYTHAHLVCHRDLKPENILFDSEGNVKLSDFGLSNTSSAGKLFNTWCGSPMYAPPEVVMEQKYRGHLVDVWSLGIILYVMVTGGMPWRLERGQVRDMELFLGGVYAVPDDMGISPECVDILDKMIQSNPSNRAFVSDLMNHPWITNNGRLPPPDHGLSVPKIASSILTLQLPRSDPKYIVDEKILIQVQEAIGLSRSGMLESRTAIQRMQPCPALTAYCILAQASPTFSLMVQTEQLPLYMRHRRHRSEIPKSSEFNYDPLPSKPLTIIIEESVPEIRSLSLGGDSLPPSYSPPARHRASTGPSGHQKPASELPIEEAASRRENKQSATRHVFRTLLLKLKWPKK